MSDGRARALSEPSRLPQRAFVEQVGNRVGGNQTGRSGRVWHLRAGRGIMGPVEGRTTSTTNARPANRPSRSRGRANVSYLPVCATPLGPTAESQPETDEQRPCPRFPVSWNSSNPSAPPMVVVARVSHLSVAEQTRSCGPSGQSTHQRDRPHFCGRVVLDAVPTPTVALRRPWVVGVLRVQVGRVEPKKSMSSCVTRSAAS
jgi:hypothetical protein